MRVYGQDMVAKIGDGPECFQVSEWSIGGVRAQMLPEIAVLVTGVREAPNGESRLDLKLKDGSIMTLPIYEYDANSCTCAVTSEQRVALRAMGR